MTTRKYVRIFRSAKVDHLSLPRTKGTEWAPICGQRSQNAWVPDLSETVYPGTHMCYRCKAISENGGAS